MVGYSEHFSARTAAVRRRGEAAKSAAVEYGCWPIGTLAVSLAGGVFRPGMRESPV